MVDLKTKKIFLKKSPCPDYVSKEDFVIGGKVFSNMVWSFFVGRLITIYYRYFCTPESLTSLILVI